MNFYHICRPFSTPFDAPDAINLSIYNLLFYFLFSFYLFIKLTLEKKERERERDRDSERDIEK
jgi:hypothetical protein